MQQLDDDEDDDDQQQQFNDQDDQDDGDDEMQDDEDQEDDEDDNEIIPNSQPPRVPEDGTYIDALNEAGVDQARIDQLQQNINADEFNIF